MSNDMISLSVNKREATGKKVAGLRAAEILPAVVYGKDFAPISIQASYLVMAKVIREAGTHSPVELDIDGKKQTAIIKSIDMDYVANRISHVSFQAVRADQIVTTEVPVVIVGEDESEAKRIGLMIMQSVDELEIKAKPADLPERLEISAENLKEYGDKLTVADIKLPAGVVFANDEPELTIATVEDPAVLAAANEADDKAADAEKKTETPAEGEVSAETPAEGDAAKADENAEKTE